jgi:hypothetical protein
MKKIFTLLFIVSFVIVKRNNAQALLNEIYTDPGAGKHEFFELYNTSTSTSPVSMNNYTLVTFFEISGEKGFYVMDLPNLTISPKGYFVGSSALPFNYQGVNNSTASDFSWNTSALSSNQGSLKKWVQGGINLVDGNLFYDQAVLPANFNDFFYRRTGTGSSYTIFLYHNGVLINTFLGGTGGQAVVVSTIINMPQLYVDMSGTSPDFTINFSNYSSIPLEYCNQDAGSDNGFIREKDGHCGSWVKSSAQVQHTPKSSNGTLIGITGSLAVSAAISPGTEATGSTINYDIVAGPTSSFPAEMQIYIDVGTFGKLDPADVYLESKIETNVSEGPFYTTFFPYNVNILIVVKSSAGCLDKILYIPNSLVLSLNTVAFEGERSGDETRLKWSVAANENTANFLVERSINGGEFEGIALLFSTDKTGDENYTYNDITRSDLSVTYRLRTIDKGGVTAFSKLLAFQPEVSKTTSSLTLYGNPVTNKLHFSFMSGMAQVSEIRIYDMSGNTQFSKTIHALKGNNEFTTALPATMKAGVYVVNVSCGAERKTAKFIKL